MRHRGQCSQIGPLPPGHSCDECGAISLINDLELQAFAELKRQNSLANVHYVAGPNRDNN